MNKTNCLVALLAMLASFESAVAQAPPVPPSEPMSAAAISQVVNQNCVGCHNQRLKTGGLVLENIDTQDLASGAEIWEKVIRKVNGSLMPPAGLPRPEKAVLNQFTSSLAAALDRAAELRANPGRVALHRLNRTEYSNAVRDLLALQVDATSLLPPDDSSYGFDNIADVLGVSASVLERYMSASFKVSALAVGDRNISPVVQTFQVKQDLAQDHHVPGLPIGTRGGISVDYNFPLDGEYTFRATLFKDTVNHIRGLEFFHQLEIAIDGVRVRLAGFGGRKDEQASYDNQFEAANEIEKRFEVRVPVKAGPHTVTYAFLEKNSGPNDEVLQPFTRNIDPVNAVGLPQLDTVSIAGPFQASGPGDTPSRRSVFVCRPARSADEVPCARRILTELARKAYRHDPTEQDLEDLLSFYQRGRNRGTFDAGIQMALARILASPQFLFRFEPDPPNVAPGAVYRINDFELASRLSFFLWSTLPDDQLLTLASQGKLNDPKVLEAQVKRMLADPRAENLVTNFAGQWLFLRNLKSIDPSLDQFPNFDDNLRTAMLRETQLFIQSIIREDRSVSDLLTANYTFVNERLARHYGITGIYGDNFRRIALSDPNRGGLLGQASILTITSYPTRTSPVQRGKWILSNILGTPPPAPPPNVPALKTNSAGAKVLSVRERMEAHRANPACSGCHRNMDPIGFSLENFDAVGEWRNSEDGARIDASGVLPTGAAVDGPETLRKALLARPDQFPGTFTEKLMTFALGRGVEYYDMPAVRKIVREAGANDYRFSSVVLGIVNSTPFRMKRAAPRETETASVAPVH